MTSWLVYGHGGVEIVFIQVKDGFSHVFILVKDARASPTLGSCRGGSEDQLLALVRSVLGGSTWEEAPFPN